MDIIETEIERRWDLIGNGEPITQEVYGRLYDEITSETRS